ncbi:MAG: M28 family peptidase [Eubacteriales bacterium]|nr:M28 family peptidase [Eubacteriales bacterium]
MKGSHRFRLAAVLAGGLLLFGCAGPSTRVLPGNEREPVQEMPGELPVLEEVNPYYLQETLGILAGSPRISGSSGEAQAARYISGLFESYGYDTVRQQFLYNTEEKTVTGTNVEAVRTAAMADSDILVVCANHDTAPGSPGAGSNASGTAVLLEIARLLSRMPSDTELRFVSFSGANQEYAGARYYVQSLTKREKERIIGVVYLDSPGSIGGDGVVLGTADGKPGLAESMLSESSWRILSEIWTRKQRTEGNLSPFVCEEIPAVSISGRWRSFEEGTPLDTAAAVDMERMCQVVDVVSSMASEIISTDTPSMMAKAHSYNDRDYAFVQKKNTEGWFGRSLSYIEEETGRYGVQASENTDSAGRRLENYQFRMKWFQVDQLILTNCYFTDGRLTSMSLEAAEAGIGFEDMKERISAVYGEPTGTDSSPFGTEYDWTDPVYHKFFALIPDNHGYDLEIREYSVEKLLYEQRDSGGNQIMAEKPDSRCDELMKLVRQIWPAEGLERIRAITFYTDGAGGGKGYLTPMDGEDPEETGWELGIDVEDALYGDGGWKDRTETVLLLTGLYGELLKEDNPELYFVPFQALSEQQAADGEQQTEPRINVAPGSDEEQAEPPDFVTAFRLFALAAAPEESRGAWGLRMQFFAEQEELGAYRTWLQENLHREVEGQ